MPLTISGTVECNFTSPFERLSSSEAAGELVEAELLNIIKIRNRCLLYAEDEVVQTPTRVGYVTNAKLILH